MITAYQIFKTMMGHMPPSNSLFSTGLDINPRARYIEVLIEPLKPKLGPCNYRQLKAFMYELSYLTQLSEEAMKQLFPEDLLKVAQHFNKKTIMDPVLQLIVARKHEDLLSFENDNEDFNRLRKSVQSIRSLVLDTPTLEDEYPSLSGFDISL